ncbi:MAG: ATP-binding cassette domain-containing protein [Corynebacterium sp.]|uniref:ABC transporter ATP-binding protein n=1 Tax=Corynebacterium sp. TaxID=1720 RepID=UPI0026DAF2F6|nr:ATP-binding cassette domain-containing protein [Corynebacterium sp.]MDO5030877.1 ATP-binding cassette domain-containing protein [Corynebacterium sp.]
MSTAGTALPLLQLRGITVAYGKNEPVLNNLDMSVRAGEVYGLLGLNGAGKSTLMSTVLGLLPYSGEIRIAGRPWTVMDLDRIGASINGPAFYPQLSAAENLRVHAHLTGTDKDRIDEVLDMVGLHAGNKRARAFSTGMKVRLALAMALLTDPDILLLDEPTNGLDPEAIVGLRTLLRHLADSGKAVVVSSHQLGEVEKSVDHLGVLAGGRLVYEGPLADFAADGQSLEQAFFTAVGVAR